MAKLPTLNIGTASSPIVAVFSEANPEQRLACYKLGATAFLPPLTPAQYIEREEFVSTLPLSQDNGSRIWCVYKEDDPNRVVSTCRTIDRDLIVRDAHGVTQRERGYCIASVVSDQEYRERGLASFLLEQVAEWMDGPGQGVADFLYTSNRSAFYAARGWDIAPSSESAIRLRDRSLLSIQNLPSTQGLTTTDIPALCDRDIHRLTARVEHLTVQTGCMVIAVLPTANLVSWLHSRANFYTSRLYGKSPQYKGSICDKADVWIYWHHDYRMGQLIVQRVSCPEENSKVSYTSVVEALASLIVDARNEAAKWHLSAVAIWDPIPAVDDALKLLSSRNLTDEIVYRGERKEAVGMVRRRRGLSDDVIIEANEHYAWN